MPGPSVTYTFANSTTADATQVNQNFTDLINGLTDGTKDLSISALTCAGAATLNGNVTLGNATGDDITVTGSLASTIPIKTTNSFNIGSATLGLAGIYFGANSQTVRIIGSSSMSATWTLTLPVSAGTSRYRLETDGSGVSSWQPVRRSASDAHNLGLAASVSSNALTISLKGADGNDPSSTNPVDIVFRNATSATGTPVTRTVTSSLSVTASSGSTLGHVSAINQYIWVYAIDNAGTVELAVSGQKIFDDGTIQSTTAEGGSGGADTGTTLYSTTARSNIAIKLIGRIKSNQTTAGTWATTPSEISLITSPEVARLPRVYVNAYRAAALSISASTDTDLPFDTESEDSWGTFNISTGIFTAPFTGNYEINAMALWIDASFAAGQVVEIRTKVNSTLTHRSVGYVWSAAVTPLVATPISVTLSLTAGDTLAISVRHNSAGSRAISVGTSAGNETWITINLAR